MSAALHAPARSNRTRRACAVGATRRGATASRLSNVTAGAVAAFAAQATSAVGHIGRLS